MPDPTHNPVTEDIYVTYSSYPTPTFTFADGQGTPIPNGDISAYPGANSFTFHRAAGQTWTFGWVNLALTSVRDGGVVTMASNSLLEIGITPVANGENTFYIHDVSRETRPETLEYSFEILVDGAPVVCDPKMYNQT